MKSLLLRPYHGKIMLAASLDELRRHYKKRTGCEYPYEDDPKGGRYILIEGATLGDREYLVYGATPVCLAHEITHVLLRVFQTIGSNPADGDGEPFCYMQSQLLKEAGLE